MPDERGADRRRARAVAPGRRAADEVLELRDGAPVSRHRVQPDVARVPGQQRAKTCQLADRVHEHAPGGELEQPLRRRDEPVDDAEALERVDAQQLPREPADRVRLDPVRHRPRLDAHEEARTLLVRRPEARGEAAELGR